MKSIKILSLAVALAALTACETPTNTNTNANRTNAANTANTANTNAAPTVQNLSEVPRPQKIADEMKTRGEQDNAAPTLSVVEPKNNSTVNSSTVKVKLALSGDLKGYKPMKDMTTQMGNHIHIILDNQPYEAYYNLDQEFELRNVSDGEHTLRFFPSRPWHESYKNEGAFQMVKFTVKNGGADATKPTVTNGNQTMSNANSSATNAAQPPEGKDMKDSKAGAVDATKPLLTYSRPKANNERYPEFGDARLESFKAGLLSPAPIYPEMEEFLLTAWLDEAVKTLGANDPFIKAAVGDANPSEVVKRAVAETKLKDVAARKALLDGGADAIAKSNDPMIVLARRIEPIIRELRAWNEEKITSVDARAGEKIAKARFAVYGRTIAPDANFNLRITFGKVKGYEEDTTLVPFKTTFFGLYDRAESFGERPPYDLPARYKERRDKLNLSTPLNFVYSADTIGGMSGSPVINRNAEFVGINFDSNIQKLSNRYWYIEEEEGSRAVAVHSAGILEALRKVYDADALARELTGK